MNQIEALQRLRSLGTPVVETRDVAALLQTSTSAATTILRRLTQKKMITQDEAFGRTSDADELRNILSTGIGGGVLPGNRPTSK